MALYQYQNVINAYSLTKQEQELLQALPKSYPSFWYETILEQAKRHPHNIQYKLQFIANHLQNHKNSKLLWDPQDPHGFITYLFQHDKNPLHVQQLTPCIVSNYIIRYNRLAFCAGDHKTYIKHEIQRNIKLLKGLKSKL